MSSTTGIKPKQKISFKAKTKKWADDTAEYYRRVCVKAVDDIEALKNYRLANGQLDESEYLYVTNPLNTQRQELLGSPARLRNWDIISPNINLLMGEKARRQFPPVVIAKNSTAHIKMMQKEQELLVQELQKQVINYAIQSGLPLEEEKITMELQDIQKRIKNLPDTLANLCQDTLEYIMDLCQMPRKFRQGFYDYLCQGCVYSYKDTYKEELYHDIISPLYLKYLCSENKTFINKGEAACCLYKMSVNEIYDRFQDDKGFAGEVEDYINQYSDTGSTVANIGYTVGSTDVMAARAELFENVFGAQVRESYASGMVVEHVMFRSLTKIGYLTRTNIFNEVIEDVVDDSFIPMEGDEIRWEWEDEIWENYCINDKYWLGARAIPTQNGKHADLLYNGRNMMSRHTRPTPLVKKGEAYQKSVNIIKYRAEATLAKNLDKVILFPLGLIPKKEGWDEDKLMYYVRSFSFLFFDDTRPNASQMIQAMKDLDLSSLQHVIQAYQLVQILKQEWDESCGIIPQRKGQVAASAGKSVTQDAQDRSYVMSEEMFLEYDEFERDEYEGMLELSKYAFSTGLQAHFIKQDGTKAFLDLHDPETFLWLEMGVFVKNGAKELNKLEVLRNSVLQAFAQNGVDPKMLAALVESENFAKIHEIMDQQAEINEARAQQAQALQANETAAKERMAQGVEEFKYYDADLKSTTDIQVALIGAGIAATQQMQQLEAAGKQDTPEYGAARESFEKGSLELLKNATKLKEIEAKIKMNKLDNETALKNKVVGQK